MTGEQEQAMPASNPTMTNCSGTMTNCNVTMTNCNVTMTNCRGTLTNGSGTMTNCRGTLTNGSGTMTNCRGTLTNGSGTMTNCRETLTNGSGTMTNCSGTMTNCNVTMTNCRETLTNGSGTMTNCSAIMTNSSGTMTTCSGTMTKCSGPSATSSRTMANGSGSMTNCRGAMTNMQPSVTNEKLLAVLDYIGISEDMRKTWNDFGISTEIILNLRTKYMGKDLGLFKFGSSIEGSTTPGLFSDLDFLVLNPTKVFDHFDEVPKAGKHYLIVQDTETRPGYVKLQVVLDGVQLGADDLDKVEPRIHYAVDCKSRLVRNNVTTLADMLNKPQQKGPAQKCEDHTFGSLDYVEGYYSDKQPSFATSWQERCKGRKKWTNIQEKLMSTGCFYVAVGHPFSKEKHLEWRISLSLQERNIAFNLSPVQFKCYVMLKIIKKEFIEPVLEDTLSSYHCKTCIYHMIEHTEPEFWSEDNFIVCLKECLLQLLRWVKDGNCPNYFLTKENMFDRKIHSEVRVKLESLLQNLLDRWNSILYDIKCDKMGELLASDQPLHKVNHLLLDTKYKLHMDKIGEISTNTYRIVNILAKDPDPLVCVQKHLQHLQLMKDLTSINFHDEAKTADALDNVRPYIDASLACNLIVLCLTTNDLDLQWWYYILAAVHFGKGMSYDLMSTKLKLACVLYRLGQYTECERILHALDKQLQTNAVVSYCGCRHTRVENEDKVVDVILQNPTITTTQLMRRASCGCVSFQLSEMDLVPYPLRYEMFRSVGAPEGTLGGLNDYWYRTASMDSKTFLYFLQYLVFSDQKRHEEKKEAVEKLLKVLAEDNNLKHRETAYNVLGWVCRQEGYETEALVSFKRSWDVTEWLQHTATSSVSPFHNAVKWHIADMVYLLYLETLES